MFPTIGAQVKRGLMMEKLGDSISRMVEAASDGGEAAEAPEAVVEKIHRGQRS